MTERDLTRHEVREGAFLLLYAGELNGETLEENLDSSKEAFELITNKSTEKMAESVNEHVEELDNIISEFSKTRAIFRIPKISLIILRIALYEMIYDNAVPGKVAINEAIELSKEYAYDKDRIFINGVLDAYLKKLEAKGE